MVIVNFIRDPEVGLFARAKRVESYKQTPGGVEKQESRKVTVGADGEESDKSD